MSSTVISVKNISKMYNLYHKVAEEDRYLFKSLFGRKNKTTKEFWALNDVSFEVKRGDRLGIIGRNGAGKSTLLKILSRIVEPTRGSIEYEGKIASLLEVGTGFHPELTGRENIFLNGSILGMSKDEIRRKFDEIVAFAEVENFLDTPVKRYSSGMYVRLAFAVAAHLEPEILIVDEVLTVGDAAFQKKCLGKMKDVAAHGRTILFVSHNMAAIQNLCDKCVYLKNGTLVQHGKAEDVIPTYLRSSQASTLTDFSARTDRMGNGSLRFMSFNLKDKSGQYVMETQCGGHLEMEIEMKSANEVTPSFVRIAIGVDDDYGQRITHFSNEVTDQIFEKMNNGTSKISVVIPELPLKQGNYTLTFFASVNGEVADWIQEAAVINVEAGDFFHTGKLPEDSQGNFYVHHSFSLK
jgi:lipopolysaccharide transport system ATP-binding protein